MQNLNKWLPGILYHLVYEHIISLIVKNFHDNAIKTKFLCWSFAISQTVAIALDMIMALMQNSEKNSFL
jgi:hypothetical protein